MTGINKEIANRNGSPRVVGDTSRPPSKNLQGVRILLAEDIPDNQVLMKLYLAGSGAHVEVASNGLEAVSKAQAGDFDLILMDIQMPLMDGIEATQELRSKGYDRPILALTAHAMSEEVKRSLQAGCNAHLTKPISKATLLETVASFTHKTVQN